MLIKYVEAALRQAHYELLGDGGIYGSIPALRGVWANAPTLEARRAELEEVLHDWLMLSLSRISPSRGWLNLRGHRSFIGVHSRAFAAKFGRCSNCSSRTTSPSKPIESQPAADCQRIRHRLGRWLWATPSQRSSHPADARQNVLRRTSLRNPGVGSNRGIPIGPRIRWVSVDVSLLCIQIQPNRMPGVDLVSIRNAAAQLGATQLFKGYSEKEGLDDGPYLSLFFDAVCNADAWSSIFSTLYEDARFGAALQSSSIAVCQGQRGWDDYLLLHHFDPTVFRDRL